MICLRLYDHGMLFAQPPCSLFVPSLFHSQYTVVLQLGIERQGGGCGWMMMDVDGGCGGRMPQRDAKGEVLKVS